MTSDAQDAFNAQNPLAMVNGTERGLFDDLKEDGNKILDFFGGVSQQDVAERPDVLAGLSRADRVELLVDGKTSNAFGSSPWSIGLQLDASIADQIHAHNGGTLVFSFGSTLIDLAESKLRAVRYALVWDDTSIAETGTVDLDALGTTFLIVATKNEPTGQTLTLWLTDNDLVTRIVQQGTLADVDKIRNSIQGQLGAAGDKGDNPALNAIGTVFGTVSGFFTTSAVGGIVALAIVGVVLVMVVRSEAFGDVAKTASKVV